MVRILRPFKLFIVVLGTALMGQPAMQGGAPDARIMPEMVSQPVIQDTGVTISEEERVSFDAYLQLLAAKARAEGVREETISAMIAGMTLNPRVIALDRSQPGTTTRNGVVPTVAPYLRSHVNASRIARGRAMRQTVAPFAAQIEQKYSVPLPILLAIWGHETDYGDAKGGFDLARSLATLAFEGRRRDLFADEFVGVLKMADRGVPRSRLVGSWAGALGNPQFLPSMYLRLAVDGDGDGDIDVWSDAPDTLASIANYFHDAGWREGEPWGVRASVPDGFDWSAAAPKLISGSCARVHARHSRWLTVAEWRNRGVQPQTAIGDDVLASLFQPDGPGTPAWLLTGNYRVILHYNCSNFYALSVGLLADEIAR